LWLRTLLHFLVSVDKRILSEFFKWQTVVVFDYDDSVITSAAVELVRLIPGTDPRLTSCLMRVMVMN
jgi:hypothetical protein